MEDKSNGFTILMVMLLIMLPWLSGVVLAKGFLATLTSILFAPYGWYLTVEKLMQMAGMI
jgi:hypothetical protein